MSGMRGGSACAVADPGGRGLAAIPARMTKRGTRKAGTLSVGSATPVRGGSMSDRVPMTRQGYDKLEADLRGLKTVDRPQIVKEIEIARAHGDISENAEFHAAKERQSHIEGRIRALEDKLARAQVIDPSGPAPESVRFGVTVVLLDAETDEEVTYTLVGEDESDIAK